MVIVTNDLEKKGVHAGKLANTIGYREKVKEEAEEMPIWDLLVLMI